MKSGEAKDFSYYVAQFPKDSPVVVKPNNLSGEYRYSIFYLHHDHDITDKIFAVCDKDPDYIFHDCKYWFDDMICNRGSSWWLLIDKHNRIGIYVSGECKVYIHWHASKAYLNWTADRIILDVD